MPSLWKALKIYIPLDLERPPLGGYLSKIIKNEHKNSSTRMLRTLTKTNKQKNHRKIRNDTNVSK